MTAIDSYNNSDSLNLADFFKTGARAFLPSEANPRKTMIFAALAFTIGLASANHILSGPSRAVTEGSARYQVVETSALSPTPELTGRFTIQPPVAIPGEGVPSVEVQDIGPDTDILVAAPVTPVDIQPMDSSIQPPADEADEAVQDAQNEPKTVEDTIVAAAQSVGVEPSVLLAVAWRESRFEADARSRVSSATGLFQFTRATWYRVMTRFGAEHGLGDLAGKIEQLPDGRWLISDKDARKTILALRHDPHVSSVMAAELLRDNNRIVRSGIGRKLRGGEVYLAHFFGASAAVSFLRAYDDDPDVSGASLFPDAAHRNTSIFFAADGTAFSVAQIHERMTNEMQRDIADYAKTLASADYDVSGDETPGMKG